MRMERVASVIKEEIGMLILREFNDPTMGFVTVTEVHMTPDLKLAKIYVSILGNEEVKARTMHHLEEHKSHVRSIVGAHVRLKFTPAIQFYLDETMEKVIKLEEIFKKIHEQEPKHDAE